LCLFAPVPSVPKLSVYGKNYVLAVPLAFRHPKTTRK
jgi:hypothetical protein